MKFIITTLFIVSCIIAIANCGDYYEIDGRTYYTSYPEKKTWNDAKLACTANETVLVDIPTADENDRLLSVINQTETKRSLGLVDWWTSGSDQKSENKFVWETTGNPVIYTNWHTGEPSNGNGVEHCIAFYRVDKHGWNDNNCTESLYFICRSKEVELPEVFPVHDPVLVPVDVETVAPVTDRVLVSTKVPAVVPVIDPGKTLIVEDPLDANSGVHRINGVTGTISTMFFMFYIITLLL